MLIQLKAKARSIAFRDIKKLFDSGGTRNIETESMLQAIQWLVPFFAFVVSLFSV